MSITSARRKYRNAAGAKATDDGSFACIHKVERGSYWDDEYDRLQGAIAIASLPQIRAAPTIRQLLDVRKGEPFEHDGQTHEAFWAIWEWADISLYELLNESPDEWEWADPFEDHDLARISDAVATNVRAALDVLHGIGFVHMDVAPNNILRVDGIWKLADLDTCVRRGTASARGPINPRYVHPDRKGVVPARDEFDNYGLQQVLARMRDATPPG